MKPQLIIPMTGISSRFTAAGYTLPKFLLEVDGQTVVEHVLDMFPDWDDVIFCCNEIHLDNPDLELEKLLLSRRPAGQIVRVTNNTKGPGWAVLQAENLIDLDRPVVVNYCDFTCYWDSNDISNILNSGKVEGCIPAYTGFHPHMGFSTSYAYLKLQGDLVSDIQEKQPWTEDPHSEYASSGTYGFSSGKLLLDSLKMQISNDINLNGEYYLSLTYKPLLASGGRVSVLPVQHFMQWGTPQDFEEYKDLSNAISEWSKPRSWGNSSLMTGAKVILASGAGKRFSDVGYRLPKPALSLAGKTLLEHSVAGIPGEECIVVTRHDLNDGGVTEQVAIDLGATVVSLPGLSRGQAESALFGVSKLSSNRPVTVGACDAIFSISADDVSAAVAQAGDQGLIVWASSNYSVAKRKPEQYGWVDCDSDGHIQNSWIKLHPEVADAFVITGTFSFGSRDHAINLITKLIDEDRRVKGEFYLDSLIELQQELGLPCVALKAESFVSVGTPLEYESLNYWQSCFHKWALHPYNLKTDPMVAQGDIMRLNTSFHEFSKFPSQQDEASLIGGY